MIREVVHSIRDATPEGVLRLLDEAPPACGLVEIRADDLRAGDVSGLVRRAGRPVVVTVRAVSDGGSFDGSAEEKRSILEAALRAGCAFVDVEWEGPLRDLAIGPLAPRTVLSHHGAPCDPAALLPLWSAMAATRAERLKIVPRAARASDALALRGLLARAREARRDLCAFASGAAGSWSRVFAIPWGSWGTYGAVSRGRETGDGQQETRQLLEVYRVSELSDRTAVFGLFGTPLQGTPSPALHAAGYRALGIDAVYVPIDTGDLSDVEAIVSADGPFRFSGLGVTIPLKERVASRCFRLDAFAACGAANTVTLSDRGWEGFNTDAPAALALIRKAVDPHGCPVAVVGAGGTARAIAAALSGAGAVVTMYNRTMARGEDTARAIGVRAAPLGDLPRAAWDVLVQATPIGRHGEELVPRRHLTGRMVLDAAYGAEPTPLVRAARARGLAVADGLDLLEEQANLQFARLTARDAPRDALHNAVLAFRDAARA